MELTREDAEAKVVELRDQREALAREIRDRQKIVNELSAELLVIELGLDAHKKAEKMQRTVRSGDKVMTVEPAIIKAMPQQVGKK